MTRRYDQYPQLAAQLRKMSLEGRQFIAIWHRILITALEGYIPQAKRELVDLAFEKLQPAVGQATEAALGGWLRVMLDVAAIIVDPSEADWCCKLGMLASPDPCPQHGGSDEAARKRLGE